MTTLPRIGLMAAFALAGDAVGAQSASSAAKTEEETEVFSSWGIYNNQGWTAYREGDLDLARDRFARAVELVRPHRKEQPRLMARSCHDLARVLCEQKRYAEAEPLARWVVEARERNPRVRDDVMFDSLYLLAVVRRELGHDAAELVPLLRRAARHEEKHLGGGAVRLGLTLQELADAEAESGALADADVHYRRAVLIYKRHGVANFNLVDALSARGDVLEKLGKATHAKLLREEAVKAREEAEARFRLADHVRAPLSADPVLTPEPATPVAASPPDRERP